MAFRDQVENFEGKRVRVETTDGTFCGILHEVKSETILLKHDGRRTLIRDEEIIAVTEED